MPVLPSSPGAVQLKLIELAVVLTIARLVTAAGGVVSVPKDGVVKVLLIETEPPDLT